MREKDCETFPIYNAGFVIIIRFHHMYYESLLHEGLMYGVVDSRSEGAIVIFIFLFLQSRLHAHCALCLLRSLAIERLFMGAERKASVRVCDSWCKVIQLKALTYRQSV